MTTYDVEIHIDERDAPGMQPIVDMIYDGLIEMGARDGYVEVLVKGPPELRIGALR